MCPGIETQLRAHQPVYETADADALCDGLTPTLCPKRAEMHQDRM